MKKTAMMLAAVLALGACGAKQADKPAERPATAKVGELAPGIKLEKVVSGGPAVMNVWEDLKGKAVVLEFWGTYCDPCVENIPHLNALADKFKNEPVAFVSISRESEQDVREFLKEHELKGIVAADAPLAYRSYLVRGIPHTVLVDKDGRIAAITYPTEVNEKTIEGLLAGKATSQTSAPAAAGGQASESGAEAYFSVAPSINGRSMRTSRGKLDMDGYTLAEDIEKVVEPARPVEYKGVDKALLAKKYSLIVKVADANAARPGALRELGVAGLNSAFPFRISTAMKERKALVIKKAGAFPAGLVETPGSGFSASSGVTKSSALKKITAWDYTATRASIAGLADQLGEWMNAPVIDETGLGDKGYAFAVKFGSMDLKGLRDGLAPLGLQVEEALRKVEVAEVTARR